jgi:hypothetical protein
MSQYSSGVVHQSEFSLAEELSIVASDIIFELRDPCRKRIAGAQAEKASKFSAAQGALLSAEQAFEAAKDEITKAKQDELRRIDSSLTKITDLGENVRARLNS